MDAMSDTWAVVVAALGASLLTAVSTFGIEAWRDRLARSRGDKERLREACAQLNSHAIAYIHLIHGLQLTAVYRAGLGEGLAVATHQRKPIDAMELTDRLPTELRPMLEAQAVIQLLGDEEVIRSAAGVILAANDVMGGATKAKDELDQKAAGAPVIERFVTFMANPKTKLPPEVEKALSEGVMKLGHESRRFAQVTRTYLDVNDPDAVIRAFPAEPVPQVPQ
jgi:hypothetical protein